MSIAKSNAPIPENVAHIIKSKGLYKRYVAEKAGYTSQQLTDMLNGRKLIKPCDAAALANALGVDVGDLLAHKVRSGKGEKG